MVQIKRIWARLIWVKVSGLWERIEYRMTEVAPDGKGCEKEFGLRSGT